MAIFNSYVKLPEGMLVYQRVSHDVPISRYPHDIAVKWAASDLKIGCDVWLQKTSSRRGTWTAP